MQGIESTAESSGGRSSEGPSPQAAGALVSRGICNLPAWMMQHQECAAGIVLPAAASEQHAPPSPIRIWPPSGALACTGTLSTSTSHHLVRACGKAAVSEELLRECARCALARFTESEPQSFLCHVGSEEASVARMTSHALQVFASCGFAWPPMSNRKERLVALVKSLFR
jgi:hypothetical protein